MFSFFLVAYKTEKQKKDRAYNQEYYKKNKAAIKEKRRKAYFKK